MIHPGSIDVPVQKFYDGSTHPTVDQLAVEEPLEIRLAFGPPSARTIKAISVTMRTPGPAGEDFELALGFLFAEGIIHRRQQVTNVVYCGPETGKLRMHNVVRVELAPDTPLDLQRLERHFYMTSSCGVCGKTSIEALQTACHRPLDDDLTISSDVIRTLPEFLRAAQAVFERTGGLHAAALFDPCGKLLALREDVGRHNALDKLVGSRLLSGELPARHCLLLLSGRASFELLQKAIMAGIPVVAAVGAPSSLAVDLAREFHVTLLGFLRDNRFNIYAGEQRIRLSTPGLPICPSEPSGVIHV